MLYKKNSQPTLSDALFRSPTSEYRGTPFWSWNYSLNKELLTKQIDYFKEMGMGGFHMHVRTGLTTQYLGDEFMELVRTCVDKAKEEGLLAWLYDEDRWPSGAAGGLVTKDPQYRARCLLFTPKRNEEADQYSSSDSRAEGGRSGKGVLLACYDVCLDEQGYLQSYRRIGEEEAAKGVKWYAYLEIHTPSSWYNHQTYVDTLSQKAIERFLEVTHERYKSVIGDEFDKTVPAIFTDEPQFTRKHTLNRSDEQKDMILPWTDDVPKTYQAAYGSDLMDGLPELIWELPDGKISTVRYHYHDHIAERFAHSFADTVGGWCQKNGIALTGHMMEEPTLGSQTAALGEAMRSYRSFTIPGIDMLCASHEFTTAKQCASVVHQAGKEGMLSELYGVTGWDYDFRGYKSHGDWQAALGVTVRNLHLSWVAMAGEAKRDYPASIFYQSPWYQQFSLVEDHFARVNTAMTRGKPIIRVAVIHPVESYWLHWGPSDKTSLIRTSMEERFGNLTNWLLRGSIDFDFISESLLPSQCQEGSSPLQVGCMAYDTVIVPFCETLRSTTFDRLEAFAKAGGKLIVLGAPPTLENAIPSARGQGLLKWASLVPFDRASVLASLEDSRTLTLRYASGSLADHHIYQLRRDGKRLWLFVARCDDPYNKDLTERFDLSISLEGFYQATLYDSQDGTIRPIPVSRKGKGTEIDAVLYTYDSLLLALDPVSEEDCQPAENKKSNPEVDISSLSPVLLPDTLDFQAEEKNVLLLDLCQYSVDDGEFFPEEEVLKADDKARDLIGISRRGGEVAQPWTLPEDVPCHFITLRYTIESQIEYEGAFLALEEPEKTEIQFNGQPVPSIVNGHYVDISIQTVAMPKIQIGKNLLQLKMPLGIRTNTEASYLLGNFGVSVIGRKAQIVPLPQKIPFGDLGRCGFPFYGGNMTYRTLVNVTSGKLYCKISDYRGGLIRVFVDGVDRGAIVYAPYTLLVDGLQPGEHEVEFKLFGNRFNTFGAVHLVDVRHSWHGPWAWRSNGENWSYEYVFRPLGILKAPEIKG